MSLLLATSTAHPWVINTSLLYGMLNWGEAQLIPTWLMQEHRLAQVKINQSMSLLQGMPTHL